MIRKTLLEQLQCLHTSTPEAALLLNNLFVPVAYRAGTSFAWHEQATHLLYFIETGLVRGYVVFKNEEYTCWVLENGFMLPVNQSFTGTELEYTAFMRDCKAWMLNLEKTLPLVQTEPVVCRMLFEIWHQHTQTCRIRELMLKLISGDERFSYMLDHDAELMDKIPHEILASLLSVTPKYLYQLKKKYR